MLTVLGMYLDGALRTRTGPAITGVETRRATRYGLGRKPKGASVKPEQTKVVGDRLIRAIEDLVPGSPVALRHRGGNVTNPEGGLTRVAVGLRMISIVLAFFVSAGNAAFGASGPFADLKLTLEPMSDRKSWRATAEITGSVGTPNSNFYSVLPLPGALFGATTTVSIKEGLLGAYVDTRNPGECFVFLLPEPVGIAQFKIVVQDVVRTIRCDVDGVPVVELSFVHAVPTLLDPEGGAKWTNLGFRRFEVAVAKAKLKQYEPRLRGDGNAAPSGSVSLAWTDIVANAGVVSIWAMPDWPWWNLALWLIPLTVVASLSLGFPEIKAWAKRDRRLAQWAGVGLAVMGLGAAVLVHYFVSQGEAFWRVWLPFIATALGGGLVILIVASSKE